MPFYALPRIQGNLRFVESIKTPSRPIHEYILVIRYHKYSHTRQQYDSVERVLMVRKLHTGMQAEVVKGLGEVGHVGLQVAAAERLASHKVGRETQLLGHRQDKGSHARHVLLQRLAGDLDQIPVQLHAHRALLILALVHAPAHSENTVNSMACRMRNVPSRRFALQGS